jgi:hypothetical protein
MANPANDNFIPFQKIPRLKRGCIITEKIDGTNAQVVVRSTAELRPDEDVPWHANVVVKDGQSWMVSAGSRTRWISPDNDNFGFAAWVKQNAEKLVDLGPGQHFGEWWGVGIQRGYGLHERRFSLFNSGRWSNERPACCHVVPTLYEGEFSTNTVDVFIRDLRESGSRAAPSFMRPEGIIVFMTAARHLYKVLAENDELPKGVTEAA